MSLILFIDKIRMFFCEFPGFVPGNFPEFSWKFPRNRPQISRKFSGIFLENSCTFPGHCLLEIFRKCPGNFPEMSWTCSDLFRNNPGKFPDKRHTFEGVLPERDSRTVHDACSSIFPCSYVFLRRSYSFLHYSYMISYAFKYVHMRHFAW